MGKLFGGPKSFYQFDLLLETKESGDVFKTYKRGGSSSIPAIVIPREFLFFPRRDAESPLGRSRRRDGVRVANHSSERFRNRIGSDEGRRHDVQRSARENAPLLRGFVSRRDSSEFAGKRDQVGRLL